MKNSILSRLFAPLHRLARSARPLFALLALMVAVFVAPSKALAQVGTPDAFDPAINAGGSINSMAHQADGMILFGGTFSSLNSGATARVNLARVNAAGVADTTFNANITSGAVQGIAVQPDGKILIVGPFTIGGSTPRIARLNSDGSLDSSFTATGVLNANRILLQPDGKILAVSTSAAVAVYADGLNIARLNPDGSHDTAFTAAVPTFQPVNNVALQGDGKIVYGLAQGATSSLKRVVRLNADGSSDTAFNTNVPAALALGTALSGLAVQSDGRIVFGMTLDLTSSGGRNGMNRLMPDGTLDTTWAGPALTDRNLSFVRGPQSIVVQADGKLVVAGIFGSATYIGATRLAADGSLDATFAPTFLNVAADGSVLGALIQADGKVLTHGGTFTTVNGLTRNRLARLNNDAATQALTTTASTVTWTRGGSAPDAYAVSFENSTNGGSTWTLLGNATRVGTTANWQLTGQSLTGSGQLRATALYAATLNSNGMGSSVAQQVASYSLTLSNNADLSALALTTATLNESFSAVTTAYTSSVPNATSSVTVTATRAESNATLQVQINGGGFSALTSGSPSSALNLNVGANPIDVKVTAQDGSTIKTYTITVTRAAGAPAITGTMMFTQNTGLGDGIAQDGEAGSSDIPGITMQVINITDTAGTFFPSLSWQNNTFLASGDSGYSALTYDQNAGTKGMAIKSSDGSEFQLNQFLYYNWGETSSTTITVKGYRNTVEVASTTFAGWINTLYMPITVNLDSTFDNVDDVRLYISAGGYQGDQSATNHSINNIVIAPPCGGSHRPRDRRERQQHHHRRW